MPSHLRPGLTPGEASHICMEQCRAMCCRGPLLLELKPSELPAFKEDADGLGLDLVVRRAADGGGWIRFTDYRGEMCPMLDPDTFECRIYDRRPSRCREFPEKPTPGCAISGG